MIIKISLGVSSYYENNTLGWSFRLEEPILLPRFHIPKLSMLIHETRIFDLSKGTENTIGKDSVRKTSYR